MHSLNLVSCVFAYRTKADKTEARDGILFFEDSAETEWCTLPEEISCNFTDPYRTADGSCNNLKHTWWGSANQPLRRILPPDYADGNPHDKLACI